jgi:WXXGXW repeat (2 copies)
MQHRFSISSHPPCACQWKMVNIPAKAGCGLDPGRRIVQSLAVALRPEEESPMPKLLRHAVRTTVVAAFVIGSMAAVAVAQEFEHARPPLRVEVIVAPPGPGYNWVPGHWAWAGRWEWIPGHHVRGVVPAIPVEIVEVRPARPSPGHMWVRGHHVFEGARWVWRPGVWVRL